MKKILIIFIFSFSFINSYALTYGGCEYSAISRLKSIVQNINLSYDYKIVENQALFDLTITNLTSDIYFYDTSSEKYYYYSDTDNGEITIYNYNSSSGQYIFYSNISGCSGIKLGTKYYNFPVYNNYYTHELCSDIPNYGLCQKWSQVNYSLSDFEKKVLEYKSNNVTKEEDDIIVEYEKTIFDIVVDYYINYYYYLLGGIIIISSVVIIIVNKKNRFKL